MAGSKEGVEDVEGAKEIDITTTHTEPETEKTEEKRDKNRRKRGNASIGKQKTTGAEI